MFLNIIIVGIIVIGILAIVHDNREELKKISTNLAKESIENAKYGIEYIQYSQKRRIKRCQRFLEFMIIYGVIMIIVVIIGHIIYGLHKIILGAIGIGLLYLFFAFTKNFWSNHMHIVGKIIIGCICLLMSYDSVTTHIIFDKSSIIIYVGLIGGFILVLIGTLQLLAAGIFTSTKSIAKSFGASEKTANEVGEFAVQVIAKIASVVLIADIFGNLFNSNNADASQAINIDTSSATPDFSSGIDVTSNIDTPSMDFSSTVNTASNVDVSTFTNNKFDGMSVTDVSGMTAMSMSRDGSIFDIQQQFAGRFDGNTFFDSNNQFAARIDGNNLYDSNNLYAGTINDNGTIFDSEHKFAGRIDEHGNIFDNLNQFVGKVKS